MQSNCPKCSHRIVIDDSKVPDRPFKVKCPKCQTSVSFPGKAAAAPPVPEPAPPQPPSAAGGEDMRAHMMAQLRREMADPPGGGRALVSVPDRGQAGAITVTLTRLGHQVDTIDDPEEGARLLEQGVYGLVATSRSGAVSAKGENLYQRLNRMSPDNRRRAFLILVGDEYATGDAVQAWATVADLVLNTRDVATADGLIRATLAERNRIYQVYLDARQRHEAASA